MSGSITEYLESLDHAITVAELSRLLNIHKLTLYRQVEAGILPHFRIGAAVRLDPRNVAKWLRQRGTL
jgi:excisionase family DNA binding protein